MDFTVVVGLQFGDEGKGKIVDVLAGKADFVVRFNGGSNAGHTVVAEGRKLQLHVVPSGIVHGKTCIIGAGVVLDPLQLLAEITELERMGVPTAGKIFVDERASLVLPFHKKLDGLREIAKGSGKIGTTGRGIGPAYEDRAARIGLRAWEVVDEARLKQRLTELLELKNRELGLLYGDGGFDFGQMYAECGPAFDLMRPLVNDVRRILPQRRGRQSVLLEGAQGTLLDVDFGTYPFCTSSSTTAGGACTGAGVSPRSISKVIGVAKAYTTRVGSGPFPTELADETGERLRRKGAEFGTTTGRPRRCGWFDAVIVGYAARLNGVDSVALTKLDVLSGLEKVRICTAYAMDGAKLTGFPADLRVLAGCKPVYEDMDGWSDDISGVRRQSDLPPAARRYVGRIRKLCGAPISCVSVGPDRDQLVGLK